MDLDILAFAAHPDDVELGASGTVVKHIRNGLTAGIVDLTRGELGTRGSAELRDRESARSSEIMGLSVRENIGFRDGFFVNDERHQLEIVKMIRKYRPRILLANAVTDRHPDHGRGADVVRNAVFLSGLPKVDTELENVAQKAHRPEIVLHYIQFNPINPDIVIPFDEEIMEVKMQAVQAFPSQFYDPHSDEPETIISGRNFLDSVRYRAADLGRMVGAPYGEGFTCDAQLSVKSLEHLI